MKPNSHSVFLHLSLSISVLHVVLDIIHKIWLCVSSLYIYRSIQPQPPPPPPSVLPTTPTTMPTTSSVATSIVSLPIVSDFTIDINGSTVPSSSRDEENTSNRNLPFYLSSSQWHVISTGSSSNNSSSSNNNNNSNRVVLQNRQFHRILTETTLWCDRKNKENDINCFGSSRS